MDKLWLLSIHHRYGVNNYIHKTKPGAGLILLGWYFISAITGLSHGPFDTQAKCKEVRDWNAAKYPTAPPGTFGDCYEKSR